MFKKTKPVTRSGKILAHLKKVGRHGAWNYELSRIGGLSWHRRVGNLRADGHNIQCVQIKKGLFRYYLNDEEA